MANTVPVILFFWKYIYMKKLFVIQLEDFISACGPRSLSCEISVLVKTGIGKLFL